MVDWNDIKNAFERDAQKAEQQFMKNEQTLLKSIAKYLSSLKGESAVQAYKPEEVLGFLEKPVAEIKSCLGNEWADLTDDKLETLIYSLSKKVKKSDNLIEW